jgi:hypothetical protein
MSTTHTQGEWAFDDNEIYSESTDHGAAICTMNTTSAHFTEEEVKANARLLAAAPELLETLKQLIERCLRTADTTLLHEELYNAQQAIQKATQP